MYSWDMYSVVEPMFLLRRELACLRDLPNIRGDDYRQTTEGGGGILIYRVFGIHLIEIV